MKRAPYETMLTRFLPAVCLATATTERFVPGTLVLIDSFLRRHPGFDGEVVVIHDGLPGKPRAGGRDGPWLRRGRGSPPIQAARGGEVSLPPMDLRRLPQRIRIVGAAAD